MEDNNVHELVDMTLLANVYGSLEDENFVVNTASFLERIKVISGLTSDREVEDAIKGIVKDRKTEGDSFSSKKLANKWKDLVSIAVSNWLGEKEQRDKLQTLQIVGLYFKELENQRQDAFKYIFSVYENDQESKRSLHEFFRLVYDEKGILDVELHRGKVPAVILYVLENFFTSVGIRTLKNDLSLEDCINTFHSKCHDEIIGYPYNKRNNNRLIEIVHEARRAKNKYHPPRVLPPDVFKKLILAIFVLSVLQKERINMEALKNKTKKVLMLWYTNHKDCFSLSDQFVKTYWEDDKNVQGYLNSFFGQLLPIDVIDQLWTIMKNNDEQGNIIVSEDGDGSKSDVRLLMESCLGAIIQKYGAGLDCGNTFENHLCLLEKMAAHIWDIKDSWSFDTIEEAYSALCDDSCQYGDLINGHMPKCLMLFTTICSAIDRFRTGIVFYRKPNINPRIKINVRDTTSKKERNVREKAPWFYSVNTNNWRMLKKNEEYRDVVVSIENKEINEKVKVEIGTWTMVALGCESGRKPSVTVIENVKYPGLYFDENGAFVESEQEDQNVEPKPVEQSKVGLGEQSKVGLGEQSKVGLGEQSKETKETQDGGILIPEIIEDENTIDSTTDNKKETKPEEILEPFVSTSKVQNVEFVYDGVLMIMNCPTPKVDIYYTLDGTEPTLASTRYLSPFRMKAELWPLRFKQKKIVKAIAIKRDWINSDVTQTIVSVTIPFKLWLAVLAVVLVLVGATYKALEGLRGLMPESKAPTEQVYSAESLPSGELYPSLDGKAWIVKEMDGERVATGQVNAEIRMSGDDQTYTECRMAVVGEYESQFRQITFNYDRQTGQLTSPQLGMGKVEKVNKMIRLRITFEGWTIEK